MLIGVGDLHIDKLESKIPGIADRILEALRTVYARAADRGFDTVVLLGDVFDVPDPDDTYKIKMFQFLYEHRDMRTLIIMGNHDFANVNAHALRWLRSLFLLKVLNGHVFVTPKLVAIHGERYWFCPHPYVVPAPKPVRYSFGHFAYNGAKADNGYLVQSNNAPAGRWLLGDFHTPQRGRNFTYLGSLTQLGWSETPRKFYMELEDTPRFVRAPETYLLKKLVVNTADDLAQLDDTAWWQVVLTRGLKLPENWQASHPNVIDVRNRNSKADNAAAQALIRQQTDDDPLAMLVPLLRERGVLTDREIARAKALLDYHR